MTEEQKPTTNGHPALKIDIQKAQNGQSREQKTGNVITKKPKRIDRSDLGENFVAPDGGWGWVVAVASGVGTLVVFALMQQYGIVFRVRLESLGINNSQMTTITNTQAAISAVTGLLNGPLFRRFTFRQIAVFGSLTIFLGLFLAAFADSFLTYMITISFIYGIGRGFVVSASSLAVNTYFKVNRRKATAYQFAIAGVGPMFLPYMSTYLLATYGVQGTVLVFSAISLNALVCALTFQPVSWHVKKPEPELLALADMNGNGQIIDDLEGVEVEEENPTFDSVDPDTPMMARANDGWYGSKLSLQSARSYRRSNSVVSIKAQQRRSRTYSRDMENGTRLTEVQSQKLLENGITSQPSTPQTKEALALAEAVDSELDVLEREKLPFYKKVIVFFDLDLLRDPIYVSLVLGLTVINFSEVNFAVLTPFILSDFGFNYKQIAIAMSVLATTDLISRFSIPFATSKINFSNKTFFIIGVIGLSLGRIVVAHSRNFPVTVCAFAWMGMNKGFRVVFWNLIIPGYVPLNRLPAAAGLQLLISGLFTLAAGPVIGMIRDATNYSITIHCLNALCFIAVIVWIVQDLIVKPKSEEMEKK